MKNFKTQWKQKTGLHNIALDNMLKIGKQIQGKPENQLLALDCEINGGVLFKLASTLHKMPLLMTPIYDYEKGHEELLDRIEGATVLLGNDKYIRQWMAVDFEKAALGFKVPVQDLKVIVESCLKAFAAEHDEINYSNNVQLLAKRAIVAFGNMRFELCLSYLNELWEAAQDISRYKKNLLTEFGQRLAS